jgi:hypothetical protein
MAVPETLGAMVNRQMARRVSVLKTGWPKLGEARPLRISGSRGSTPVGIPGVDDGGDDAEKGQGNKRDQNVLSEPVMEDHISPPV